MHPIFSVFLTRETDNEEDTAKRVAYLNWFCDTFPTEEFRNEEYVFKNFLDYCVKLDIPCKSRYLGIFMDLELRPLLVKSQVHVAGTETIFYDEPASLETAIQITKGVMSDIYRELEALDDELLDFRVSANTFMVQRLNERLGEVLSHTYEMTTNDTVEDASEYALQNISSLREIYDTESLEELDDRPSKRDEHLEFVCDTGLKFIDDDLEGIYTTQLGGVEAQPGTGKTRFVLGRWVYRAAVTYKRNVMFISLEQNVIELKAILIALHTFYLFNIQIDSKLISRGKVPEEVKDKVEAARIDLFESGKYGKIYLTRETLYLETFIQKIKTLDKLHGPFDLICIDYMGLIEQEPNTSGKYRVNLQDYQVIGRAFRWFKRYLSKSRKAGIAISQFNDKGIEAGKADKVITTNMAQGGIEVYRNTDFNIAISMTDEMRAQQKRRFSQPKLRDTGGFGSPIVDTRLGFAYFYVQAQTKI